MKRYLILIFLTTSCLSLFGQQEMQYTLYMLNPFIYNPALAGTNNYYQIRSNHRFQWAGFKDAPVTNSISAFGPHSKKPMGYGGTVYNDITGPTSKLGIAGSYAYNIRLTTDLRLSMGLSLGIMQYKVDGTKIKLHDEVPDDAMAGVVYSKMVPDGAVGIYVWNSNLYAGFSALQLLNNTIKISDKSPDPSLNKLRSHFYIIGGYVYNINRQWSVDPSLALKKVVPSPYQMEISVKATYQKMLWAGLSFRTQDAVSFVLGYTYEKKIFIGIAYDYAVNEFRRYASGSYEIGIGYNFTNLKTVAGRSGKKK